MSLPLSSFTNTKNIYRSTVAAVHTLYLSGMPGHIHIPPDCCFFLGMYTVYYLHNNPYSQHKFVIYFSANEQTEAVYQRKGYGACMSSGERARKRKQRDGEEGKVLGR